jgi:hypothetical protein
MLRFLLHGSFILSSGIPGHFPLTLLKSKTKCKPGVDPKWAQPRGWNRVEFHHSCGILFKKAVSARVADRQEKRPERTEKIG